MSDPRAGEQGPPACRVSLEFYDYPYIFSIKWERDVFRHLAEMGSTQKSDKSDDGVLEEVAAASELLQGLLASDRSSWRGRKRGGREGPAGPEQTKQVRKQRLTESERKRKLYSEGKDRNRLSALQTTRHRLIDIHSSSDLTKTPGSRGWGEGRRAAVRRS